MHKFMISTCIVLVISLVISLITISRSPILAGPLAFALSSSDAQQVLDIVRQELRNLFNPSNVFSGQIIEKPNKWINMVAQSHHTNGDPSTDIIGADYSNNGRSLNATLFTYSPFEARPTKYEQVNYGMLIDSDFNNLTGSNGIDYQLEISWHNKTQTWSRTLTQWTPTAIGKSEVIAMDTNVTNPFYSGGTYAVPLSLDLNYIKHQDKYRVVFYGESKTRNSGPIIDFTKWVTFPPLSVDISTSPPFITLRPGEEKTVVVKVNSTTGYEPEVSLYAKTITNLRIKMEVDKLHVPPYGTATIPLVVSAPNYITVRPYALDIFANSTLSPPSTVLGANISYPIMQSHSTMTVSVQPPLTLLEQLASGTINTQFMAGLYGLIVTPIIAWLVPRVLESVNAHRQRINVREYMKETNKLNDIQYQNKETYLKNLEMQMRKIEDGYANGKISESQYKILKDKISEYHEHASRS